MRSAGFLLSGIAVAPLKRPQPHAMGKFGHRNNRAIVAEEADRRR